MKILSWLITFLLLAGGVCQATPELDALAEKIRAALPGSEWQIVKDWHSITLIRTNVQFLNPVSLPPISEAERWNRFSFTSDYRVTLTFDTKLTQSEFGELLAVKNKLTTQRTEGLRPDTKDFWSANKSAQAMIRLPSYYLERFSVYVYTSDDNFFRIHPDSVRMARDKILAVVEKSCLKYSTTAEPDGPANGSPAIRSGTNRASPAAGSRR